MRAEVALSPKWSVAGSLPMMRWSHGALALRDATVNGSVRLLDAPDRVLRAHLGATIPVGRLGGDTAFTPLSTASVDPWAAVDLVFGGAWLGVVNLEGRVPVYAGGDGVLQGPYARLDLKAARRLGTDWVPWAGVSGGGRTPGEGGGFWEIAPIAGTVWSPGERWSASLSGRVPVVAGPGSGTPYIGALNVAVTGVFGGGAGEEQAH